jgi:hypothetical protein
MPKKVERVHFDFVHKGNAFDSRGSAVQRESVMVLDIIAEDNGLPYVLEGKLRDHVYDAVESKPPGGVEPVRARWAQLGDVFVGLWIEEGEEWLFSFRLPRG